MADRSFTSLADLPCDIRLRIWESLDPRDLPAISETCHLFQSDLEMLYSSVESCAGMIVRAFTYNEEGAIHEMENLNVVRAPEYRARKGLDHYHVKRDSVFEFDAVDQEGKLRRAIRNHIRSFHLPGLRSRYVNEYISRLRSAATNSNREALESAAERITYGRTRCHTMACESNDWTPRQGRALVVVDDWTEPPDWQYRRIAVDDCRVCLQNRLSNFPLDDPLDARELIIKFPHTSASIPDTLSYLLWESNLGGQRRRFMPFP